MTNNQQVTLWTVGNTACQPLQINPKWGTATTLQLSQLWICSGLEICVLQIKRADNVNFVSYRDMTVLSTSNYYTALYSSVVNSKTFILFEESSRSHPNLHNSMLFPLIIELSWHRSLLCLSLGCRTKRLLHIGKKKTFWGFLIRHKIKD